MMTKSGCGLFLLLAVITVQAQEDPVKWSATGPAGTVQPGKNFTARVSARINPGWHIYSITQGPGGPVPTEITVPPKQPFVLAGYVVGPLPKSSYDANFEIETDSYERNASFKVPLAVAAKPPAGATAVAIDVRFQVCNDRQCLPAKTVHLKTPVTIAAAGQPSRGPAEGQKR